MDSRSVLITGISGQDGSYLAEEYLRAGYSVHGLVRRSSLTSRPRLDHLFNLNSSHREQKLKLHYADLNDLTALMRVISEIQPDLVVNLAAQSHVGVSFQVPIETTLVDGVGSLAIFEAVRIVNKEIRIYQAGSSEMYGGMMGRKILDESSSFFPKSPYAASKVFAHHVGKIYRDSYGMFISNGILFNHESPRRGENFVSKKITRGAARISMRKQSVLRLGNLESKRDWGHARDYCQAIKKIMSHDKPDDFVVATGEMYTVTDFLELTFSSLGMDWRDFVEIDPELFRPNEVDDLRGDPSKIKRVLGWQPSVTFTELVREMLEFDLNELRGARDN